MKCTVLGLFLFVRVLGSSGDLDRSFVTGGFGITVTPAAEEVTGSVLLPDGSLVVVGSVRVGSSYDSFVSKFTPNGLPDPSFDVDGTVITSLSTGSDGAGSVAVQDDGKLIVAATRTNVDNGRTQFVILRYMANGTLDNSFDGDGILVLPFPALNNAEGRDVIVTEDNKIIAVGRNSSAFAVVKLNPDGTLDSAFGDSGIVSMSISGNDLSLTRVALLSDGRIVLAGTRRFGGTNYHFAVVRLNANGTLDTSFDGDGLAVTKVGVGTPDQDAARAVVVQHDDRIVVAGDSNNGSGTFFDAAAVRYNLDGSLDQTFGGDGKVHIPFGNDYDAANDIALQQDGKLVLAGNSIVGSDSQFALARINPDGSPDMTFGISGKVVTYVPPGRSVIRSVAVLPNKKIMVSGDIANVNSLTNTNVVIARYQGTGTREWDYDGDRKADLSVRRPANNVWYLQRGTAGYTAMEFGIAGDRIVPADYDGDGKTDVAVFRPSNGTWYVFMSQSQTFQTFGWGTDGDVPVPTDRDNDGKADLVIYRESNSTWYTRFANATFNTFQFGVAGDKPMQGDFDGDGVGDVALFRPSNNNWYLLKSSLGFFVQTWGQAGDIPLTGDFDGDGATDQAVFRPSTGQWFLSRTTAGFSSQNWGQDGDIPVAADYDGDGKTDVAVFRPSNGMWYIVNSTTGILILPFGQDGDVPTQAAYLH
ncbi:MAG: VCBS repeat-containing protein [Chloracidobacterium sp.]|nr:VCBS repeat-containing protein [Chloracidobacterium sp.]